MFNFVMDVKKWLIILLLVFVLLRLPQLDAVFYGDENAWPYLVEHQADGLNFQQPGQFVGREYTSAARMAR